MIVSRPKVSPPAPEKRVAWYVCVSRSRGEDQPEQTAYVCGPFDTEHEANAVFPFVCKFADKNEFLGKFDFALVDVLEAEPHALPKGTLDPAYLWADGTYTPPPARNQFEPHEAS